VKNPVRLLVLLVATLVGALALSSCSSSSSVQTVGPQEWLTKSQEQGVVVLDVRTPGEFAQGHVDGAVNVDVESGTFDQQIEKLDKGATYVVYCRSGNRSKVATDAMAGAGFTSVYNLQGGLVDLQSAGASVVTG
jgi:rhodanese-related sulfurtransferase